MRAVSVLYHGMFSTSPIECLGTFTYKYQIADESDFNSKLKSFMSDDDYTCQTLVFKEQLYQNGDIVVMATEDCDNLEIGLVKSILVKGIKVYQRHKSQRVDLQYFMCQRPNTEVFEFIEVAQLVDFKPLIMRGTINKFVFTLHHHVSHDYE